MAEPKPYEIYAIKYGDHQRRASENFLGGDPHNGPMPIDYFTWVIKGAGRAWGVDTGFSPESGRGRGRNFIRCPSEGLRALDIDPDRVEDVIITHMHYDHAGNHHLFPRARFHLQDKEMFYGTGRCLTHAVLAAARLGLEFFLPHALRQFFPAGVTVPSLVHLGLDLAFHQELGELAPLRLRLDPGVALFLPRHDASARAVSATSRRPWRRRRP